MNPLSRSSLESPRALWDSIPDEASIPQPINQPFTTTSKPFTVLNASELLQLDLPPKINVLGDGVICMGQLTTIIGQGGSGKSRFAMQIAISQILGWPVAKLPTYNKPLRHLLIGTENSIYRQKNDLQKMTSHLSPDQRDQLGACLFFHVVREIDDAFISIGSDDIRYKWLLTLEEVRPNCIFIDPFGEVNVGDINKDADVRHTLRELTKVCRRYDHDTAIIIVHHARTGRQNIAQAVGWDKGNFALGSKALYSGARSQINIAPADPEDHAKIVVSCGKSNDAKPFEPVGLRLNEETMFYEPDPTFDLSIWKDDVEGKSSGQSASIKDVIEAIQSGSKTHNAICRTVSDTTGCSKSTVKRRVQDALEKNYIRKAKDQTYFLLQKALSL